MNKLIHELSERIKILEVSEKECRVAHLLLDFSGIANGDGTLRDRIGRLLQLNAAIESDKLHLKSSLLQILKDVGDASMKLKEDSSRLFDKTFPWELVNKATYSCVDAREKFFPNVPLWEMTNDEARAASIKETLGCSEKLQ